MCQHCVRRRPCRAEAFIIRAGVTLTSCSSVGQPGEALTLEFPVVYNVTAVILRAACQLWSCLTLQLYCEKAFIWVYVCFFLYTLHPASALHVSGVTKLVTIS